MALTTCELAASFRTVSNKYPNFKPDHWAALIKIYPKAEQQDSLNIGGMTRTTLQSNYLQAVLGAGAPGLGVNGTGRHGAWMDYAVHMYDLLHSDTSNCSGDARKDHTTELANRIGIENWLDNTLAATNDVVTPADFEFDTELIVRLDASGSLTYFTPYSSIGPALAAYRSDDIVLTITFADDAKYATVKEVKQKVRVRRGAAGGTRAAPNSADEFVTITRTTRSVIPPPAGVTPAVQQQLQLLQLQQAIGGRLR